MSVLRPSRRNKQQSARQNFGNAPRNHPRMCSIRPSDAEECPKVMHARGDVCKKDREAGDRKELAEENEGKANAELVRVDRKKDGEDRCRCVSVYLNRASGEYAYCRRRMAER